MSSAYNSNPEKRKGLLCCFLALLRKGWTKCWISEFVKLVLSFSRIEEPDWGAISPELIPVRVGLIFNCCFCETVEYRVILWTFLCPDSCIISVGSTSLFPDFTLFTAKVKRCIVGFHFRGSLFCVDFVGLYWTFWLFGTANIFSAMALTFRGSFLERVLVSLSLNWRYSCPVEVSTKLYVSLTHLSVLLAA